MKKENLQNLIKNLVEKTGISVNEISVVENDPNNIWVSIEIKEPHFYLSGEGEGLHALNHLVHRIMENETQRGLENKALDAEAKSGLGIIIDINDFQKKRVENVRAVAHMMGERARYFKSSIEVDPMPAFERRIIHEFLSNAKDLKTESTGFGRTRRVVIKYIGEI